MAHPEYRPDIDGLRAIAVLAVVAFHAFPNKVTGGFTGVDIFFVISGYLISTILFSGIARGTFSVVDFYGRRIRRIFPALLVVLVATGIFGWFALLPDEYGQLGKHVAGGAGFIANILLWKESGYFDTLAGLKPLLHLWSLGIEEQFYLVWPLLLWLCWKRRVNWLAVVIVVGGVSFLFNVIEVRSDTTAAFYSPQSRFWELMAGSAMAYVSLYKPQTLARLKPASANVLSLCGAGLIAVGILVIDERRAFPGWWAVLPTAGAVLIIAAGASAWVNRVVLSSRALVWFGLISFPLYLWHWPLLSFARILVNPAGSASIDPARDVRVGAVLISIALAWLTFRWIERPVRFGNSRGTATAVALLVLMTGIGWAGFECYAWSGFPGRVRLSAKERAPAEGQLELGVNQALAAHYPDIFLGVSPARGRDMLVARPAIPDRVDVAVAGDSHAWQLYAGLVNVTSHAIMAVGRGTCPPFLDVDVLKLDGRVAMSCQPLTNNYLLHLKMDPGVKVLLLNAFFGQYGRTMLMTSGVQSVSVVDAVSRTLRYLAGSGKVVVLSLDVPEVPASCYRRSFPVWNIQQHGDCTIDRQLQVARNADIRTAVETVQASFRNVVLYDPARVFCDDRRCGEVDGDHVLYLRDGNHLNGYGRDRVAADLARFLAGIVPP